ncbi:prephenate dehydrogenase [soil metagenome]
MTSPADAIDAIDTVGKRRAAVVGTGLIGGSIGLALRRQGWHVTGRDHDHSRVERALALGALDAVGEDPTAEITFIATPVQAVAVEARAALAASPGLVTDVGSVKGSIVAAVDDARFVGGHPMAGSEQVGVDGADDALFAGSVWVLTPVASTEPEAYATVRSVVSMLGADVVALAPDQHDALVAVVSHVHHLAAAALMGLARERANEQRALLRLAAGGFRDMTRIAAGHPGIWPDICDENRTAIVGGLDQLIAALGALRDAVEEGDRSQLLQTLTEAHDARRNLPGRYVRPEELVEVRVPVPDRPGVLAEVATLATDLEVNIGDLEIAHSSEGQGGVLILVVEATQVERLAVGLAERGYRAATSPL